MSLPTLDRTLPPPAPAAFDDGWLIRCCERGWLPDALIRLGMRQRMDQRLREEAIHNGELSDSTLIIRKIAKTPIITVATPAYLARHGTPATPGELDRHACVAFAPGGASRPWGFRGGIVHQPRGAFRTNDAEQIRAAVLADLGLAHTPGWLNLTP